MGMDKINSDAIIVPLVGMPLFFMAATTALRCLWAGVDIGISSRFFASGIFSPEINSFIDESLRYS